MADVDNRVIGKHRGTVANNIDPMGLGRVQVEVPSVLGDGRLSWAMPCVPYAGRGVGLFMQPPVGALIWVEFEGGDPDYPIWSGCFWGPGETPEPVGPTQLTNKTLKTEACTLTLSDLPGAGGLKIEVGPPAVPTAAAIEITAAGLKLSVGTTVVVNLTPASVDINGGALTVLP